MDFCNLESWIRATASIWIAPWRFVLLSICWLFHAEVSRADPVQEVIDANQPNISACYEKLREKSPKAAGTVDVSWHVSKAGKTSQVKVKSSTIKSPAFHQCLKAQIGTWTFPPEVGPDDNEISYTFGPPL